MTEPSTMRLSEGDVASQTYPPYRVLPSTMTRPAHAARARTYADVESALHAMGEGIVVDARDHLVAFPVSMHPRLAEQYVAKIKARDRARVAEEAARNPRRIEPNEPGEYDRVVRALTPPEPTRDQSQCDVGRHQACSGYTEDEGDPETCLCTCHDPDGGA